MLVIPSTTCLRSSQVFLLWCWRRSISRIQCVISICVYLLEYKSERLAAKIQLICATSIETTHSFLNEFVRDCFSIAQVKSNESSQNGESNLCKWILVVIYSLMSRMYINFVKFVFSGNLCNLRCIYVGLCKSCWRSLS